MTDQPTIFPPQHQDAGAGHPGLEHQMTPEPEFIRAGYKGADKLKGKAEQISVGTNFDQSGFGWAKGCPADPEIALGFVQQSFTIPFSRICGPLEALSLAGVGITLLGCMVWVIGGKKA